MLVSLSLTLNPIFLKKYYEKKKEKEKEKIKIKKIKKKQNK